MLRHLKSPGRAREASGVVVDRSAGDYPSHQQSQRIHGRGGVRPHLGLLAYQRQLADWVSARSERYGVPPCSQRGFRRRDAYRKRTTSTAACLRGCAKATGALERPQPLQPRTGNQSPPLLRKTWVGAGPPARDTPALHGVRDVRQERLRHPWRWACKRRSHTGRRPRFKV